MYTPGNTLFKTLQAALSSPRFPLSRNSSYLGSYLSMHTSTQTKRSPLPFKHIPPPPPPPCKCTFQHKLRSRLTGSTTCWRGGIPGAGASLRHFYRGLCSKASGGPQAGKSKRSVRLPGDLILHLPYRRRAEAGPGCFSSLYHLYFRRLL